MKKLLFVLSSLLCFGSSFARANTIYTLSSLTPGAVYVITPTVAPGSFTDIYNFTLPGNGAVAASNLRLGNIFNIPDLGMELFDTFGGTGTSLGSGLTLDITGGPDNYSAKITGTATGSVGGLYSFALTAVPLPASLWLFGAGVIGLIGIARRG